MESYRVDSVSIGFVGDCNVGKSSIIQKFISDSFEEEYKV
jgi:GTPase SAR1 family protein